MDEEDIPPCIYLSSQRLTLQLLPQLSLYAESTRYG